MPRVTAMSYIYVISIRESGSFSVTVNRHLSSPVRGGRGGISIRGRNHGHGISSGSLGYCSSLRRETSINREYPMSINGTDIPEREDAGIKFPVLDSV